MTDRFAQCFARTRAEGRAALMAFLTAGDPDEATSRALFDALPTAGADIVEIGIPAAAPELDGPIIRAAHARARAGGATPRTAVGLAARLRAAHPDLPILLMGYAADLRAFGPAAFMDAAAEAGADGLLIVGASGAETGFWRLEAFARGLAWIPIAPWDQDPAALALPDWARRGFVYAVAAPGATGGDTPAPPRFSTRAGRLRFALRMPVVAGFGIRSAASVGAIAPFVDGVAVGTVIARAVADGLDADGRAEPAIGAALGTIVADLAGGLAAAAAPGRD